MVSRSGLPASSAMARLSSMACASRWRLKARSAGSVKVCVVPMIKERLDLLGLEILEQEVPELGVPKPLGLVTDDPRRDDDRRGGVFVAEAVDVVDDLLPPGRVEDLVEPVQEEDRRIRSLQQAVQVHLVQSVIGSASLR